MIALDTNLLVYGFMPESPFHDLSRDVLDRLMNGSRRVVVPWPCVHEFLSVSTHTKVYASPSTMGAALEAVRALLEPDHFSVISETAFHLEILSQLVVDGLSGPRVHDARIAAICLGHEVDELWSADRDFSRFPALKTHNPLAMS